MIFLLIIVAALLLWIGLVVQRATRLICDRLDALRLEVRQGLGSDDPDSYLLRLVNLTKRTGTEG